jgi:hypothetical protein
MRHFRESVATVEKQWVRVCSPSYPACTAHAPYYIAICVLSGSTTFFHIISYTAQFLETRFVHKIVFWCSVKLLSESFLTLRRTERDVTVHTVGLRVTYPLLFYILMKHEFSRQIFEKFWNTKFQENPSSRSRDDPRERTDITKLIVAFRNSA